MVPWHGENGFDLLLVRPDLHVVWRGNQIPEDADAIVSVTTGRAASDELHVNRKSLN